MFRKVFGILGLCLVLLVAASGCGGNEQADRMDTKIGVSALGSPSYNPRGSVW